MNTEGQSTTEQVDAVPLTAWTLFRCFWTNLLSVNKLNPKYKYTISLLNTNIWIRLRQAREQVPVYSHGQQSLCNCSHIHVKEQYGAQQDPMTADHLDNINAEIVTGTVAMWAISSLKWFPLATVCCSSFWFTLNQVANSAILFDIIFADNTKEDKPVF